MVYTKRFVIAPSKTLEDLHVTPTKQTQSRNISHRGVVRLTYISVVYKPCAVATLRMGNAFCMMNFGYGSREFEPQEGVTGQDHVAFEILSKIMTKKQIDKMWTVYCEIDVDQSGSIGEEEFRVFFNMEKGKFNSKLFSCFDADNSGQVNFFEFTCAVRCAVSISMIISVTCPIPVAGVEFPVHCTCGIGGIHFFSIRQRQKWISRLR